MISTGGRGGKGARPGRRWSPRSIASRKTGVLPDAPLSAPDAARLLRGRVAQERGRRPRLELRRAILRRSQAEGGAKTLVEGGKVAEAAVKRNGDDRPARRDEAERGPAHPGADEILMGRHAGQPPEDAQEVVLAHPRDRSQILQLNRSRGVGLDEADRFDHATDLASSRRRGRAAVIGHRGDDALDEPQRKLLAAKRRRPRG